MGGILIAVDGVVERVGWNAVESHAVPVVGFGGNVGSGKVKIT